MTLPRAYLKGTYLLLYLVFEADITGVDREEAAEHKYMGIWIQMLQLSADYCFDCAV